MKGETTVCLRRDGTRAGASRRAEMFAASWSNKPLLTDGPRSLASLGSAPRGRTADVGRRAVAIDDRPEDGSHYE